METFAPAAIAGKKATLRLLGTDLETDVEPVKSETDLTLRFLHHGEVLEEEAYSITPAQFLLSKAAGETYTPAIPLLKFPMHLGDGWEWTGTTSTGAVQQPARASVSSAEENIAFGETFQSALRVDVVLKIGPEPRPHAERKLSFWFLEGKGVVKRDFGSVSSRIMLEE